ncbi:MAG: hypothetical protein M3Y24_10810 [Acidobacteriota bacterium]|nr:hypothetical protein [Acidobacteriota bacterium]
MFDRKSSYQPVALGLILAAAMLRLIPHPPNFAPVGALALFSGARLKGWQAYVVPLLAMLITDPILSHMVGYSAYSSATVIIYLSILIYVLLGRTFLRNSSKVVRIASVALLGSIQFFLITNLMVWGGGTLYPHTPSGLLLCYTEALPFFGYTLAADLFYAAILFGAYAALRYRLEPAPAKALNRMGF